MIRLWFALLMFLGPSGCASYHLNRIEGPGQASFIKDLYGQRIVSCRASLTGPPLCRDALDAGGSTTAEASP